jgi:hypothetical protein
MFHFTIRDLLWLMMVVGLAVGWWVDHRATYKLAEHYRSELSSADIGRAVFLQASQQERLHAEVLRELMRNKHSNESAFAGEELIWNQSEAKLTFEVDIPLAYDNGLKAAWDRKWRPADGEIPAGLKPAFNCLGVVLVNDRGHIPITTGLMTIRDSIPSSLPGSAACAVYSATSKDKSRIILPDLYRSSLLLNDSGQYYLAVYGGWRDDTTTFAAESEQLDVRWEFFDVRRLSIVP